MSKRITPIDRLIDMARETVHENGTTTVLEDMFAEGIVNHLGPALPCGMEDPPVVSLGNGSCGVLVDSHGDALTVDEARGWAAAILRACDEAEERNR